MWSDPGTYKEPVGPFDLQPFAANLWAMRTVISPSAVEVVHRCLPLGSQDRVRIAMATVAVCYLLFLIVYNGCVAFAASPST